MRKPLMGASSVERRLQRDKVGSDLIMLGLSVTLRLNLRPDPRACGAAQKLEKRALVPAVPPLGWPTRVGLPRVPALMAARPVRASLRP